MSMRSSKSGKTEVLWAGKPADLGICDQGCHDHVCSLGVLLDSEQFMEVPMTSVVRHSLWALVNLPVGFLCEESGPDYGNSCPGYIRLGYNVLYVGLLLKTI